MDSTRQRPWSTNESCLLDCSISDLYCIDDNNHLLFFSTCYIHIFSILMRRFLIKFLLLFAIINCYFAWYALSVYPNLCGEMDRLGQIPFGPNYANKLDSIYAHPNNKVFSVNIMVDDTISSNIFTIGDSFSDQGVMGYQQFLGELLEKDIVNIYRSGISPEGFFVELLNSNYFPRDSWVIVESVERIMVERLRNLNLNATLSLPVFQEFSSEKGSGKMDLLQGALAKLRIMIGYKNPIRQYSTSVDLFSHPNIHNKLFLFDSPWDSYEFGKDGDFVFRYIDKDAFSNAYNNLLEMKDLADSKGVKLIYLIAADKYEVYEPFIMEDHPYNPTLDKCPQEAWLINTKPVFQKYAFEGVKDIYRINDTHWSPIGAKIVAEEIVKRMNSL